MRLLKILIYAPDLLMFNCAIEFDRNIIAINFDIISIKIDSLFFAFVPRAVELILGGKIKSHFNRSVPRVLN